MSPYHRPLIAFIILLGGLALLPRIPLVAGTLTWQRYAGLYEDGLCVSRARYRQGELEVRALSSSAGAATLSVYRTATNTLIGTLAHEGGLEYRGEFTLSPDPRVITVRSSHGGSATVLTWDESDPPITATPALSLSDCTLPPPATATPGTPTTTPEPPPPATLTPTATPELPTVTPEPPTATPELPTATPEPPTATPELPTETPTLPTVTPELPSPTPTLVVPTVTRARYEALTQELEVQAQWMGAGNVTLSVYEPESNTLIGTLIGVGGNTYLGTFFWPSQPHTISVRSSQGQSSTVVVTVTDNPPLTVTPAPPNGTQRLMYLPLIFDSSATP